MSKSYYDTELNKKILYREPVFLINLNLKNKIGGKEDNIYKQIFTDEDIRLRFMYHIHEIYLDSTVILKNIITNENISLDKNKSYLENIDHIKKYFHKNNKFDDEETIYICNNLQLSKFKNENDFVIVQNHNTNTLEPDGKKYINITKDMFDLIIDLNINDKFVEYELVDTYKILHSINKNPSYAEYYLLSKIEN